MRKITIALLSFVFILANKSNAQSFQKGNINIDVGFGIGVYKTVSKYTVPGFTFFGVQIPPTTITNEDGAGSFMIPVTLEYGISNRIGLGVQFGVSNYFIDNTDSTETVESVKSLDYAILVNFHLLKSDKNDLFVGVVLGGSKLDWLDLSGFELNGSGSLFKLHFSDRFYFSDHIGILFNVGYTLYNYNELVASSGANLATLNWKLGGLNIGTGLAIKF